MDKLFQFDSSKIPENVNIATMTLHCKVKSLEINFENIFNHIVPEKENICFMEYKDRIKKCDDVIISKNRSKKKSTFQNSMSIYIVGNKRLHINLFRNGTIHLTGAKCKLDVFSALENLFKKFNNDNHLYNYYTGDLELEDIKINMINANISLDYIINKDIFKKVLLEKKIECIFNKTQNISLKYEIDNNAMTIIIHMKSIIISRCKNEVDIIESYKFITNLLSSLKNKIVYISIEDIFSKNKKLYNLLE